MSPIPLGILAASGGIDIGVAGYFGGGQNGATVVDKISFADDSRTTLGTGLSSSTGSGSGMQNSGVAGYLLSGTSNVNKFAFPTDSRTTISFSSFTSQSGFSNDGVAGYIAGGYFSGTGSTQSTVRKLTFSTDTNATITSLSIARGRLDAFANFGVAGYVAGGSTDNFGGGRVTTVDKYAFPSDTRTTLGTGLATARLQAAGFQNSGVAGYIAGGYTTDDSVRISSVEKFAFPTDTRSTTTSLSSASYGVAGMASKAAGYVANVGASSYNTGINKFAFPDDTRSTLAAGLSVGRLDAGSMADLGAA